MSITAPEGQKLVSFEAVVRRANGKIENFGLIDHSHPWLFTEKQLRELSPVKEQFELLWERAKAHLPGAVIIPAGSASIEGGKGVFANQIGGGTSTPPQYIGFGQGDPAGTRITAVTTDLGLCGELAAPGGTNTNTGQSARITGSVTNVTTTNLDDTVQVVGTCTAGTALAIVEAALFTTSAYPYQSTVATQGAFSGTGTGTFTVTSATGINTASTNYQIDSEVFTATSSGTTMTITARGVNGSTAATHSAGAYVTSVAATGTGNGGLCAAKGDFAVINLASADTLQLTAKVQMT